MDVFRAYQESNQESNQEEFDQPDTSLQNTVNMAKLSIPHQQADRGGGGRGRAGGDGGEKD